MYILNRDFDQDIALISQQNKYDTTLPQLEYYKWHILTKSPQLTYVPIDT